MDDLKPPEVVSNDRVESDEAYLVSGRSVVRFRDGKVEKLEGTELEIALRWILRKGKT